jgi:hypothetical protein
MEPYIENHAEVSYNSFYKGVLIKWNGFSNDEQFKSTLEAALQVVKNQPCKCWIEEMLYAKAVSNDSTEWAKTDIYNQLVQFGVRKIAFLLEKQSMRKLFSENIKECIQMTGMQYKCFDTKFGMDKWLNEQEPMKLSDIKLGTSNNSNQYY